MQYVYNSRNLLDHLIEPSGLQTSFHYDKNGAHDLTTYPGGTTLGMAYDGSQRLTAITGVQQPSGAWLTRATYSYASGPTDTTLRQRMTDDVAGTTTAYAYDAVNRLVGAHTATGTGAQKADYQYAYDPNGNRTGTTIDGVGTVATYNEADEQTGWNTGLNRTYTYDANGNELASSQGETRTYNSRNQTISITGLNGVLTPIGYLDGGQGERTDAGGSHYVNDGLGLSSETKNNQTTYYTRTPGGHLVSQRTAGATYYYLFDGLGSVVGLVDQFGNLAARYAYDP